MFDIEYKGGNCIIISSKDTKIITDPKLSLIGLKDISTNGAVELLTEERFAVASEDLILGIDGPGEYGVGDFEISGFPAQRHIDSVKDPSGSTIYKIRLGDLRLALIGNVYEKLSEEQLENIGVIDLLIVPVGGNGYTLDAIGASRVVRKISPKVVVPIHYAEPGLSYKVPQADLSEFIKEVSAPVEKTLKYRAKSSNLPTSLLVVQIERSA